MPAALLSLTASQTIAAAAAPSTATADSIETVMSAQWYDANVSLPGCDKNMPGTVIAMARVNRPSIMVYGGGRTPRGGVGKRTRQTDGGERRAAWLCSLQLHA